MKKFVKLSLAAAVASTGFVSANAGALEEAIKNTSIVGYATIRYDDRNMDDNTGTNEYTKNNRKAAIVLTSKVNDNLSFTYAGAILSGSNTGYNGGAADNNGVEGYNNGNIYTVYNYFTYTGLANTSIAFGQQTVDTVFTNSVDTAGGTQEGNGITAATTIGGVSLVAGYFNETNLGKGDQVSKLTAVVPAATASALNNADLVVVKASGKAAGIALDATYMDLQDMLDGYSIGAKTTIETDGAKFSPYARYSQIDVDGTDGTNKMTTIGTKYAVAMIKGKVQFSTTGKDGGFVAVDTDSEGAYQGWGTQINGVADAEHLVVNAGTSLTSTLSASITYASLDAKDNTKDADETYGQLTWKPSKNFLGYVRYGEVDYDGSNDGQRGRINLTYMF